MKDICAGQNGAAVEDVQQRLVSLGYAIADEELDASSFGPTTVKAVRSFRSQQGLPAGDCVDETTWVELVDATYKMGDRTLYLRVPPFHGADVSHLQMTLNVLGFSCGEVDGTYGPHTEAAVREFQANSGIFPDGTAFQETFDAIDRLHHVWMGKAAPADFSKPRFGLSRAAEVLERNRIVATGTDPISRNIVSRLWNVGLATTADARIVLVDALNDEILRRMAPYDVALLVTTSEIRDASEIGEGTLYVRADNLDELGDRVTSAIASAPGLPCRLRVELPGMNSYDGSVTDHDVQSAAVTLLDALCAALGDDARAEGKHR